jgi:hypothetical protein
MLRHGMIARNLHPSGRKVMVWFDQDYLRTLHEQEGLYTTFDRN